MRRSFGPHMGGGSGGAGGGGGGGGGGGMIKTVHRAMRAGIGGGSGASATTRTTGNRHHQPINTTLSLSSNTNTPSSPCSYLNHPVPDAPARKWTLTAAPATGEEFDWEHIDGDGSDGDSVNGFYDEFVFGNVPSEEEVHRAVSSLHEVLEPASFGRLMKNRVTYGSDDDDDGVEKVSSSTSVQKSGFGLDWTEPSMQLCYPSSALLVPSSDRVLDAFHMLQTEPLVQRMVISLSSDKAVWDAVMNNDAVRELRESITEDKSISDESEDSDNDPNPVTQVLRWIFVNTKDRVIEIVEKITKVVNELVRPMNKDEKPKTDANVGINSFDEKLRSSFFLSIVVLLIVVVSRSSKG